MTEEEIKTDNVAISEYRKRIADFDAKLKILGNRNASLAHYLELKAYWIGAFLVDERGFPEGNYKPKRGRQNKKGDILPVKFAQYSASLSHRQALAYHLASLLDNEIIELQKLGYCIASEGIRNAELYLKNIDKNKGET